MDSPANNSPYIRLINEKFAAPDACVAIPEVCQPYVGKDEAVRLAIGKDLRVIHSGLIGRDTVALAVRSSRNVGVGERGARILLAELIEEPQTALLVYAGTGSQLFAKWLRAPRYNAVPRSRLILTPNRATTNTYNPLLTATATIFMRAIRSTPVLTCKKR